jgi:hypothetical protein
MWWTRSGGGARSIDRIYPANLPIRFTSTQTLHVEYGGKKIAFDTPPTYESIMRDGEKETSQEVSDVNNWQRSFNGREEKWSERCLRELLAINGCLRATLENVITSQLFPQLGNLLIFSIYGRINDTWRKYQGGVSSNNQDLQNTFATTADRFNRFLTSSNIRRLCIHEVYGPISLPQVSSGSINSIKLLPRSTSDP